MNIINFAWDTVSLDPAKDVAFLEKWLNDAWNWFIDFVPSLVLAILIFVVGWWLSNLITKLVKKAMLKGNRDLAATSFICSFTKCALRIFVIISAVSQLGFNVTTLLTAIGAATVTIGLALQDTMANFASGVLIIINKPFKVGDFLEVDGERGTVKKILITNTYLNTLDNREIIMPNKKLTEGKVINYNSNRLRRVELSFGISYNDDILKVKNLLRELVKKEEKVDKSIEPLIGVSSHDDSCIRLDVKVWCNQEDYWDVFYKIQEDVKYMFDENGITIPYNQLDVHLDK